MKKYSYKEKKLIDFYEISAEYLTIYDITDKDMYYNLDGDVECFPAGLTVLVTALVALKYRKLDDVFLVGDEQIILHDFIDPFRGFIKVGEEWTFKELLYFLLMKSASDAAYAIAYNVMESLPEYDNLSMNKKMIKFVDLMNEYAKSIGCKNTHFETINGSDIINKKMARHVSTTEDLVKIMIETLKYPELMEIMKTKKINFQRGNSFYYLTNSNRCILEDDECYCRHLIGGVVGTTNYAGDCLLCVGEGEGHVFVTAMVNAHSSQKRFEDTKIIYDSLFGD